MLEFLQTAVGSTLPPLNQPPPTHANAYRSGPQLYARATPIDSQTSAPPPVTATATTTPTTNPPQSLPLPNTTTQPPPVTAKSSPAAPEPVGPVITVFVGNISERAPEPMIKKILATVGAVISWKRVSTFGFCEYELVYYSFDCADRFYYSIN